MIDTATIKMPAAGRFIFKTANQLDDRLPQSTIINSTTWNEGDPVNIMLGYNGEYRQEFKGFVRSVDADIPMAIECEGYAFQLRKKQFSGSWKSISLKDLIYQLVSGTDIQLSPFIPDTTLTNLSIHPQNGLAALQAIVHHTHLTAYFLFDVLYVGLEETIAGNTVNYRIGWNVPRTKELKYKLSTNRPALIRLVIGKGKNLKPTIVQAGDPSGTVITKNIAFVQNAADVQTIANQLALNHNYTGFQGSLDGLLQPYCGPSDTAILIDKLYSVLSASYFIEGIEIKYTTQGAKRVVHIGRALSVPQFESLINNPVTNGFN